MAYATLVAVSGCLALSVGSRFAGARAALGGSHHGTRPSEFFRLDVGAGVWLVLALVCLLQAVPMPLGWLEHLAPASADVWARALKPFGSPPPDFAPLSLAPHRTLLEALKMASYGVIFYLAARLGRHGMGRIAAVAFASALGVALVTVAHRALGAERLFGIYLPNDAPLAIAPILNANNRAGYLNLGFFCGLGLAFRAGFGPRGAFIGVGLLLLVVEVLLCQSRGGTACLCLGIVLVPLLQRRSRGAAQRELSRRWQVALVLGIVVGAFAMALISRPRGGLGYEESLEKLDLFARAWRLVLDHPWAGVGRGAFGSAFSTYQARAGATVFEHAENLPLQWAAEWGVPIAVSAGLAIAWSLWPVLSRRTLESPVRRCALIGVGVLCAQNLVDLGLEITAIAALAVYVLGGLAGAALGSAATENERPLLLPLGAALMALCLGLVLVEGSDSPARERERLHARLADSNGVPNADDWQALRAAVLEYPADPYFPLLGASAALAARQDALPWAARAIERAPGSAPALMMLARALHARRATNQALEALRRAIELDPEVAGSAMGLGLGWKLPPELLARAVPDGPNGTGPLQMLADASPRSSERVRWLEEALARDPASASIHYRVALELYRDVLLGDRGAICRERRDECLRRAREHVDRAAQPPNPSQMVLDAQLLELSEGPRAAEERLAESCSRFPADEACASALVDLSMRTQSPRVATAVRALIAAGCATRERCAATHLGLGHRYAALGQWHGAQSHFRQATQEWPTPESWRALASASTALGQVERAADALRRAELLDAEKNGAQ